MISKTEFCTMQLQIINQLVADNPTDQKIQYKKIANLFNLRCLEEIENYKPKSAKAIQLKIKEIRQISKHYWSYQMDQIMLSAVAKGNKWKDIVKTCYFQKNKVSAIEVKRKFQCGVRFKFLCIYREVYGNMKPPKFSDVIFKSLLQQDKIMEFFKRGSIDQVEKQCLLGNTILFKTSIEDKREKLQLRSFRAKNRVLSLVNPSTPLKLLVDTIMKLTNEQQSKKMDIVEQLLVENEYSRTFKQIQQIQSTPEYFDQSRMDSLCNADDDRKIEEIEHHLTFEDLDDVFVVQKHKVTQFGFAQLQADMEL